ncbi:MAG: DinB family protein [Bryobacteraceae bacterium]
MGVVPAGTSGSQPSRFGERTEQLLNELAEWTPGELRFRPSEDSWSALAVIDHLILAERAVLAAMRSHLGERRDVTWKDRCRGAFILAIMVSPIRVKVPGSARQILPLETSPDLPSLRRTWADDRRALAGFLQGLSAAERKQGVFRHPVGGWTTPSGALLFLHLHFRHHLHQVRRLRRLRGQRR